MKRNKGTIDDTWDDAAGRYIDSGNNDTVYSGPASISSRGASPAGTAEAGQLTTVSVLALNIPLGSPTIIPDDLVEVEASMRSPQLVGRQFLVKAPRVTSAAVQQTVIIEAHDGERPR